MAEGRLAQMIGVFTGGIAGLVAIVYFTGGAVLSMRLGLEQLPSTAAVPYLPREFLVSLGLNVVLPAIAAGAATAAALRWRGRSLRGTVPAGVAVGVAAYLLIGGLLVAKSPFPAKACLTGGGEAAGVFIGETDTRTYLGDLSTRRPRRIVSLPVDRVDRLLVGGSEAAILRLRCP